MPIDESLARAIRPDRPGGALVAAVALPLSSIATLITGELPKPVFGGAPFQFSLIRDKLMKIPAFAWGYEKMDHSAKR